MIGCRGAMVLAVCCLALIGCTNANVERLGSGGEGIVWPEHDAVFDPEMFGGIDYALDMRMAGEAMRVAATDEFKAAVADLKASELPAEISHRSSDFERVTAGLDKLISAAEAKNNKEFQEAVDEVKRANQEMMALETNEPAE